MTSYPEPNTPRVRDVDRKHWQPSFYINDRGQPVSLHIGEMALHAAVVIPARHAIYRAMRQRSDGRDDPA